MPVYKDSKTGTWYVKGRYRDWTGETKHLMKRGFALKREAVEWEQDFLVKKSTSLDMTFEQFYAVYCENMQERLKQSTWETKRNIIEGKILPFFRKLKMREITALQVVQWQNQMMKQKQSDGKPYSQTYLKTLHNQLSAIFNHAVRFYHLPANPAREAGIMGEKEGEEMHIWSEAEYRRFADAVMDKPLSFYCFEVLYWCGIREGELLALLPEDFDLSKGTLRINKTYHRTKGEDVITSPKTKQSYRIITVPAFLCEEIQEYLDMQYAPAPGQRLFPTSKGYLTRELQRGAKAAGLERIRVHDLRHSHVSLLIQMGFSAVAIAKRVGHKSIDITYRYAHLFPTVQDDMALQLGKVQAKEMEVNTHVG